MFTVLLLHPARKKNTGISDVDAVSIRGAIDLDIRLDGLVSVAQTLDIPGGVEGRRVGHVRNLGAWQRAS